MVRSDDDRNLRSSYPPRRHCETRPNGDDKKTGAMALPPHLSHSQHPVISSQSSARISSRDGERLSIRVSNIPSTWRKADLQDIFARFGSTSDVIVVSKGSGSADGFVTFHNAHAVDAAVCEMDGRLMEGNVIHVEAALPDSPGHRVDRREDRFARFPNGDSAPSAVHHVYRAPNDVRSVSSQPRNSALPTSSQSFANYPADDATFRDPMQHQHRTTVNRSSEMQCHNCQMFGHGFAACPHPLFCMHCGATGHTTNVCREAQNLSRVIVCDYCVPMDATEDELRTVFSSFGPLTSIQMQLHVPSSNHGYIFFSGTKKDRQVSKAIRSINGTMLNGRKIVVESAQKLIDPGEGRTAVYCSNLSTSVSKKDLWHLFEKYSSIDFAWVRTLLCTAHVQFEQTSDAMKALRSLVIGTSDIVSEIRGSKFRAHLAKEHELIFESATNFAADETAEPDSKGHSIHASHPVKHQREGSLASSSPTVGSRQSSPTPSSTFSSIISSPISSPSASMGEGSVNGEDAQPASTEVPSGEAPGKHKRKNRPHSVSPQKAEKRRTKTK